MIKKLSPHKGYGCLLNFLELTIWKPIQAKRTALTVHIICYENYKGFYIEHSSS